MSKNKINSQSYIQPDSRAIALYHCEKKQLFAVLKSLDHVQKLLYPYNPQKRNNVDRSLRNKGRMLNTVYDFKIAVRFATPEQEALMGTGEIWVKDGYYKPDENYFFRGHEITNTK